MKVSKKTQIKQIKHQNGIKVTKMKAKKRKVNNFNDFAKVTTIVCNEKYPEKDAFKIEQFLHPSTVKRVGHNDDIHTTTDLLNAINMPKYADANKMEVHTFPIPSYAKPKQPKRKKFIGPKFEQRCSDEDAIDAAMEEALSRYDYDLQLKEEARKMIEDILGCDEETSDDDSGDDDGDEESENGGDDDKDLQENQAGNVVSSASRQRIVSKVRFGRYFQHNFKNGFILILDSKTLIYVYGMIRVKVLHGEVNILGIKMDRKAPEVELYSPRGNSHLFIENCNKMETIKQLKLRSQLSKAGLKQEAIDNYFAKEVFHKKCVVLRCTLIDNVMTRFLANNCEYNMFPMKEDGLPCVVRNFHAEEFFSVLKMDKNWDGIAKRIGADTRMMLVGGKSVGKSTLLRYLINCSLNKFKEVLLIDLDPGQPECTISGCISVHVISTPLLGPNYTLLREPKTCIYINNFDVSEQPHNYLQCALELANTVKSMDKIPTFINFMGFNRGIGINLASSIVAIYHPNIVVQINSTNPAKNYASDLDVECVYENLRLLTPEYIYDDIVFELVKMVSQTDDMEGWPVMPRQYREMCMISYFSQVLPDDGQYITQPQVEIFKAKLSDLTIYYEDQICNPSVANAGLVALCTKLNAEVYTCHGWGIVRALSVKYDEIYLITPVAGETLEEVDHLMMSSNLSLPHSFFLNQSPKVEGRIPYVFQGPRRRLQLPPQRTVIANFPKAK